MLSQGNLRGAGDTPASVSESFLRFIPNLRRGRESPASGSESQRQSAFRIGPNNHFLGSHLPPRLGGRGGWVYCTTPDVAGGSVRHRHAALSAASGESQGHVGVD